VHLEHPELALDDLRSGPDVGGLHDRVDHPEDPVARRHLDVEAGHPLDGGSPWVIAPTKAAYWGCIRSRWT
jgi:hypothetical protein